MKILQVFDFFSLPHGGGTVDVISKLSKALADRGHEVHIATGNYELDGEYICSLDKIQFSIFHSYFNRFGVYVMPELSSVLNVGYFDVVHLHCYRSFQNAVLYRKAVQAGVPYVIDAHGSTVDHAGPKQIIRKLYDYAYGYDCLKYASKVIAETEIGVAEWRKLGVPESKITLLHPFIDLKEFENLPKRGILRQMGVAEPHIILFMGRIHKDKGLEFLVKSFSQLAESRKDVGLVIAGEDDGYLSELSKLVITGGFGFKVYLVGFLSGKDKLSALREVDVLIQPSKNEAGARPSLEALMCGTPIIVTRNTGAGLEIKKMDAGYLTTYGDVRELAETMNAVLNSDPKFTQEKIRNGQEYIRENLSLESQIPKYERLYNEVRVK